VKEKPMVEYSVRSEIVNVMQMARRHGHGRVKHALDFRGVARSSAYRWEGQVRWLLEEGPEELRRLRRELARASAERAAWSAAPAAPAKDAKGERDLMVEAAVLGNSDAAITDLLFRARGHRLSHETVRAEVAERGAVARVAFERYFAGVGTVGAADEIFLGHGLGLFIVEPTSLLISGARRAESRTAEDWRPVLAKMEALELGISDAGAGVTAAIEERGVARGADLFHLEGKPQAWLARREKAVGAHWAAVEKARRVLERPPGLPGRPPKLRVANYAEAREAADREVAEWCRLGDLYAEARATADYLTPEGQLNTPRRAAERLARVLAALEETEEGKGLAAALGGFRRHPAYTHLGVLEEKLAGLLLDRPGPEREARLARLVAETLTWRRRDKCPVDWLAQASTGSPDDELELAVLRAVDAAVRSSSSVECINSRVRPVQATRKQLSEDFIYLLAVYHNMRPFGRGSVRKGHTPAELAGVQLPTRDWIELLDLVAADLKMAARKAS
jgi:hypothetical protein